MASPGLLNLRTDLKSLRYGSDKPYITKDINNPPSSNQTGMQITKRIDDLSRISQMLIDRPGLKFIGNQALLQQVDIQGKLEKARDKKQTLGGKLFEQAKGTILNTAKIVGSTLAQVPVNGTGTHFVYAFRTDTYLSPATTNSFTQFFGAGGVEGAQFALRGEVVPVSRLGTTPEGTQLAETTAKPEQLGQLHIGIKGDITPLEPPVIKPFREEDQKKKAKNSTKDNITNALTGSAIPLKRERVSDTETTATPSTLGVSNQNTVGTVTGGDITVKPFTQQDQESIKKSKNSTEQNIINVLTGSAIPLTGVRETTETAGTLGISNQTIDTGSLKAEGAYTTGISDFRSGRSYSFDYNSPTINRERRVNLGNQGKVSFDRSNYSNTDVDTQDTLNKLNESTTRIDGTSDARDLAKLYFEIITPEGSTFLHFRAFIDSIDDNYNADWQGTKYVGRAENFYTYGGFERDINISFKIAAATRAEMKPLYRKMVFLASSTAPTYGGQGFMRGTLARLTVGSYFSQLPGVITSVKYSLIQDMPWEISMQNPEAGTDDDMQELPMGLQCSVSYKVIHDFAPQTGLYHYFTSPNPSNGSTSFLK
jgi:hypothetical protein